MIALGINIHLGMVAICLSYEDSVKPYTQVGGEFSPSCNTGSLLPTNGREVQDPDGGQTLPFRLRESIGGDWGGRGDSNPKQLYTTC